VLSSRAGMRDQLHEEARSGSMAESIRTQVDRTFYDEAISRPSTEVAIRREPQDLIILVRNKQWITLLLLGLPPQNAFV
jgi:hypothetical protein